jgi:hypothetical protein
MQPSEIIASLLCHTVSGAIQWKSIGLTTYIAKIGSLSSVRFLTGSELCLEVWPMSGPIMLTVLGDSLTELFEAVKDQVQENNSRKAELDWSQFIQALTELDKRQEPEYIPQTYPTVDDIFQ